MPPLPDIQHEQGLLIFLLEDIVNDALLIQQELQGAGLVFTMIRVDTRKEFERQLERAVPDIILADYIMPQFTALDALAIVKKRTPDIPFLLVTGTQSEEVAVECMKLGVDDYILKSSLRRLPSAVRNAIEKKKAKHALGKAETQYRTIVEQAGDGIFISDADGNLSEVNTKACTMLGYSRDEMLHMNMRELFSPDVLASDPPRLDLLLQGKTILRDRHLRRKDGSEIDTEINVRVVQDGRILAIVRDVTDRKNIEKEIRLLAHTLKSVSECVSITDLNNNIIFVNDAFLKTYGYSETELLNQPISMLRSPQSPPELTGKILSATLRGGWRGEIINRKKDGTDFPVFISTSVVRDEQGKPIALVGSAIDVTERREAEQLLRKNEERFRSLVQNSSDIITILDARGKILYESESLLRVLGYEQDELVGHSAFELIHSDDVEHVTELFLRSVAQSGAALSVEYRFPHKDGTWRIMQSVVTNQLQNSSISGIVVNTRDITEQRQLGNRLRQSQKMESIGTLAGGIAHDFNNILGIILGYISIINQQRTNPEEFSKGIEIITNAVNRGAGLVKQMLTFARKADVSVRPVNVNGVVSELLQLLKETLPKTITFTLELESDLPFVDADSNQLHQALLNLCVNARDAMPKGGTLRIATSLARKQLLETKFPDVRAEQYVRISVGDTGSGMDAETRSRIFEPFFTTKELGKGTGLGLSVVYGIVTSHSGFIDVESEPGLGTTFLLYLPVSAAASETSSLLVGTETHIAGGKETILVVEDEEMLMELLTTILSERGYRVLSATNGVEAVDIVKERGGEIDLVLSDMGLPRLGGWEAYNLMKESFPAIRIVFASGFLESKIRSEIFNGGAAGFIQKPYVPAEVLKKIRAVLDASKKSGVHD